MAVSLASGARILGLLIKMLSRAKKILQLIEAELSKRDRAIETDDGLTEVKLIVRFDQKTGEPGRVFYQPSSESRVA